MQAELRNVLKKRFDRFAVLETWNFADTTQCKFHVVAHKAQGAAIPEAVDKHVREQLFIPEDFEEMVLAAAENTDSVAKLLGELQEPRPNGDDCIPWVGETLAKEKIERLCAKGKIAIDLRGSQYLQAQAGEDENAAWPKVRGRLGTGKHLEETKLLPPQAVPQTGGVKKPTVEETSDGYDATIAGAGTAVGGGDYGNAGDTTTSDGNEGGDESIQTGSGDIFGGGVTKTYSAPATSSLNLMAKVESWGRRRAHPDRWPINRPRQRCMGRHVPPADFVMTESFAPTPGQHIQHPEFGEGVVVAAERNGFVRAFFGVGEREVSRHLATDSLRNAIAAMEGGVERAPESARAAGS